MAPFDRHIPYNSLPDLPPVESRYMDETVVKKLTEASRKLAELKGIASMLPNQSIFVNTIALREAKASSAIENIFTTDDELYKALTYQEDDYVQGLQRRSFIIGRRCGRAMRKYSKPAD